ncbi:glycosyltransferase family 2 protein [Pseudomonas putida]|uniref:glycosyltransferase family 2 protein n=1 Tax=Pseudomonas putida TaxID=303 RepID=UPI0018D7CF73|nr:glycosyltransferase family 2 protein [Pseudomonas putida]MBH3390233.1 glycosyltransferase family 2 protein [Pseudomonas putida]
MNRDALQKPLANHLSASIQNFDGAILGLQGDVLVGWAMDTARPQERPVVEVLIDGAGVALTRADQYEPQAPQGDGFHGFAVQLQANWLAEARVITARIANQAFALSGRLALPSTPNQEAAAIASQVWHTGGLRVAGWSWDPQSPSRHVQITARKGDQIISKATCNIHHQALSHRATSDHGFSLDLPWEMADGKLHIVEVVNDLGQPLAGSPIRICCLPEGVAGLLCQLNPEHNGETLALLRELATEQEKLLPKSTGWKHYPQWFEAFQKLAPPNEPALQGALGILLITGGDPALEAISLASLGVDGDHVYQLATASSEDVLPALLQLLAGNCDRIIPLIAGDHLAPHALPHLCALLDDGSAWAFADCDRDGASGERSFPWLKPVWDIDAFIGADIFTPGAIFSRGILEGAISLLAESNNQPTTDWEHLVAAIALATQQSRSSVKHLPNVLYHRAHQAPASPEHAQPSPERLRAIQWLCHAVAPGASVSRVENYPALLRANWPLPVNLPTVSLIVPTRDQYKLLYACIEGLLTNTDYPNLEIIVVDNQSTDPQTIEYLATLKERGVTILDHPFPFNYSAINNRAVGIASGEIIGLINNDIEVIEKHWLKELVTQLERPDVGAVGAKLLWPNRIVQHGGVVVGINKLAAHSGNTLDENDAGYLSRNQLVCRQSAVTAACLLVRKSVFQAVNGLDEDAYPVAFNDVDLCLKIKKSGRHIIWTPFSKLIHAESATRGKDISKERRSRAHREQMGFIQKWTECDHTDPFYHPALSHDYLSGPYGGLAMPPLSKNPRRY